MARIFYDDYRDELINRIEQSLYREDSGQKKFKGIFLTYREVLFVMRRFRIWFIYYIKYHGEFNFDNYFKMHVRRYKKKRKYKYSERFLQFLIENPDEVMYRHKDQLDKYEEKMKKKHESIK